MPVETGKSQSVPLFEMPVRVLKIIALLITAVLTGCINPVEKNEVPGLLTGKIRDQSQIFLQDVKIYYSFTFRETVTGKIVTTPPPDKFDLTQSVKTYLPETGTKTLEVVMPQIFLP